MHQNRILTLLSDFGLSDVYVGVMKGAIAQVNPSLTIVDLTHQIPPQNIFAARFCLMNAYPYFPDGTVHVSVVDPGVGSTRRAIAVKFANGFLVGPDNGLFSGVLSQSPAVTAVELTNSQYWRTHKPSTTFHGRDIFAPVGAYLASGIFLEDMGQEINLATLVQLAIPESTPTDTGVVGCIQYIDYFGNLVTNIPGDYVQGKTWSAVANGITIPGGQTYSAAGRALAHFAAGIAVVGSHGWVEIAVNGGNAQLQLQMNCLDPVQVQF